MIGTTVGHDRITAEAPAAVPVQAKAIRESSIDGPLWPVTKAQCDR
jgi:hypothetical protein